MYALLARLFGLAVDLFYRRRHLGGVVPAAGPCVVVANHPNALIDPILVMRVAGRRVRFLGKAPLFGMPIIGWLVRALDVLPVYRSKDGADTAANADTFRAVYAALAAGDCVCLFPEGISHDEPGLQPLKTGAARMALGAEASRGFDLGVRVVPLGLDYRDKGTFRSEVAVQIGALLDARAYADAHAADPRAAARDLTDAIDEAIRAVTLNLDAWDDLPLLELAGAVWARGDDDPALRLRLLADGHRTFLARDPAAVTALRQRLGALRQTLDRLGWSPDDLDRAHRPTSVARFVTHNLIALLGGLPVALVGALAYVVPYQAVRVLVAVQRPSADVVATVKVLASLLFFPAWHLLLAVALVLWLGPLPGFLLGVALPFAGLYTHHFLERRAEALREIGLFFRLPFQGRLRAALRAERDAIRAGIERLAGD